MEIRKADINDLKYIMPIFQCAKTFMRSYGNKSQWTRSYPSVQLMSSEIEKGHCHVIIDSSEIIATFCFIPSPDPTYSYIENGEWLNDAPYYVVHRLASNGSRHGIAKFCFDWCLKQCCNIRVDTHCENIVMQNFLSNYGFRKCGIIYIADGTQRIAYQLQKGTK